MDFQPPDPYSQKATQGMTTPPFTPPVVPPSSDPVFQGLAWVLGILMALLGLAKPFMSLIRQYKVDKTDSARDDADQATFERQTKQLEKLTSDVDRLMTERNVWFEEATILRGRVEKLEEYEALLDKMKTKLEEKDKIITELRESISERDERIMNLMSDLMKTNDRLHDLEVRLAKDEKDRCFNCAGWPAKQANELG
jgi:predicted RNase H-like nuclease (RuvC/YqgF family)